MKYATQSACDILLRGLAPRIAPITAGHPQEVLPKEISISAGGIPGVLVGVDLVPNWSYRVSANEFTSTLID